jgi:hypothetical protein
MTDYQGIEQRLSEPLGLTRRPVAVTFRDTTPAGVAKFSGTGGRAPARRGRARPSLRHPWDEGRLDLVDW